MNGRSPRIARSSPRLSFADRQHAHKFSPDFGAAVVKRGPLDLQSRPYAKGFAAQPDKMRFKGFSPGIAGYPGFVRQNIHGCARSASTEIGGEVSRRVICQAWARSAKRQTACKPGSVPSATPPRGDLPGVTAIPLGRPSPGASCDRPGQRREGPPGAAAAVTSRRHGTCRPYLVLLPVGFSVPPPLPAARCALTAPFHPCRPPGLSRCRLGGVLSVALSLGSPPPGVTRHRTSVEPGLSSPPYRAGSGRPAVWRPRCGGCATCCQRQLPQGDETAETLTYGLVFTPTAAANCFLTSPANSGLTSWVVLPAVASIAVAQAI